MIQNVRTKPLQVVCAVIFHRGRILAARRLPGGAHPPLFEFPGGKIIAGETPFDAIRREIKEELGLSIRPLEQGPTIHHHYPGRLVDLIPLLCDQPRGILHLTDHSEIRWIRPDELESLEWLEADRVLTKKIALKQWILPEENSSVSSLQPKRLGRRLVKR